MNCWNCGNELRDGDVFCSKCGVAVGNTQNYSGQLSGFSSDGVEKDAAIFENVRKDPNPAVWNENYSDGWGGGLSVPDNRKNVGNPSGKKKLFIALVAVFVILVLIGLIIFGVSFWRHSAGNNGPTAGQGKTEKTENDSGTILVSGREFNEIIKTLADGEKTDDSYQTTENTSIVSIQRAESISPDNQKKKNLISSKNSKSDVYAWFEDGVIYYYSDADVIQINENASNMFAFLKGLTSADIASFDTSHVSNMSFMFYNCESIDSLDVSGWDVSGVKKMDSMFSDCKALGSLDLSQWETKELTDISSMFSFCDSLYSLDLSGFNTANVTKMESVFLYCESLTSLDLSGFDTSNTRNMSEMFSGCEALSTVDVSGFNTSNVTNMKDMFASCSIVSLDVSGWDVSQVTDMSGIFKYCESLASIDFSGWNTGNVVNMKEMFMFDRSLSSDSVHTMDNWNLEKVSNFTNILWWVDVHPEWNGTWDEEGTFTKG